MLTRVVIGAGMVVAATVFGAIDSSHYVMSNANIFRIERTCAFTNEGKNERSLQATRDDCESTNEFADLRNKPKSQRMVVDGDAVVHVSYRTADGEDRVGQIKLTGRDEEFYAWHRGDTVPIEIDTRDAKHIRRRRG